MFEFIFSQYKDYEFIDMILEITAVIFGIISVLLAKKNNIWVYPTGLISTIIYTYLLLKYTLLGDMLINVYYTIMSIYGWYLWTRKKENIDEYPISETTSKERQKALIIFLFTMLFVVLVYVFFDKFDSWTSYVDTFTTGIFFVGMWLMAKRKIENWIMWIIGDFISIPLYFYKGLWFTTFQFIIFTFIAYLGYIEWKTYLQKETLNR